MEAQDLIREVAGRFRLSELFSSDAATKRRALKTLAYRLPGRPLLMFVYLYIFRMGFLDGPPGFRYSMMRSVYEFMIDLKVLELKYKNQLSKEETR